MGKFFAGIVSDAELFIRHLAWLNGEVKDKDMTRRKFFEGGAVLEVEPKHDSRWLVELCAECGFYEANGMGVTPISWTEIKAWMELRLGYIDMWLAGIVKNMSESYIAQYYESNNQPAGISPFDDLVDIEIKRKSVLEQLRAVAEKHR